MAGAAEACFSIGRSHCEGCCAAGFKKREIKMVAAHSTRIGATHALAEAGTDVLQVQQDGGWKSPQMPASYLRGQKARSGGMAQWFRARSSRGAK
jgi:hypothetical protein